MRKFVKSASLAVFLVATTMAVAASATPVVMSHVDVDGDYDGCPVPAVSEVGTLSLMAAGLGLIGLNLRRKKK